MNEFLPMTTQHCYTLLIDDEQHLQQALALAMPYGIAVVESMDDASDFFLHFDGAGLALHDKHDRDNKGLRIDFERGSLGYRLQRDRIWHEAVVQVMGGRACAKFNILDTTGGFGRDAMVLAMTGASVTVLERHPLVCCLLANAVAPYLETLNLKVIHTSAQHYLQHHNKTQSFDVIYMDPMYPDKSKTARVKKNMQLLQTLIGQDDDAIEVLNTALLHSAKVIVKRPKTAEFLSEKRLVGSKVIGQTRFDIYKGDDQ